MAIHLVTFTASITNGSTFTKLAAYQSLFENVQNNNLVVPKLNQILMMHVYGPSMSRAQLSPPNEQIPGLPLITPLNKAVPTSGIRPKLVDLRANPFMLTPGEQLALNVINGGAAAEQEYAALLLSDGAGNPVKGKVRTLRLTGSTTLTANTLTACPMTFEDNLPAGKYSCVGARGRSAGLIYFRVGSSAVIYRAGGIGVQAVDAEEPEFQRNGALGDWFDFDNLTQITMECMSSSADTAEYLEMDVIGPQ